MKGHQIIGIVSVIALTPLASAAQYSSPSAGGTSWQPAVYAGTWSEVNSGRRPGESALGPMVAFEMRRRNPEQRASFVATISGYTKTSGRVSFDVPRRDYRTRNDLLTFGLGADWALRQAPSDWTIGLSVAAVTSRNTTSEITATGLPYSSDGGWNRVTALLAARSSVTLPLSQQWGLRLGAEVLQGVESLEYWRPILGAHVGLVLRR